MVTGSLACLKDIEGIPVVSIVVPFRGRILHIELVKPKKELQWRL